MAHPPLTPEQEDEIRRFAAERGRRWKDDLCTESWWRGLPMRGYPRLYGLRNTHGGEWLDNYRLPPITGKRED